MQRLSTELLPLYAEAVCKQPGLLVSLGEDWVARLLLCVARIPQPQQRSAALDKLSRLPVLKLLGSGAYAAAAGVPRQALMTSASSRTQLVVPLFFPLQEGNSWSGLHLLLSPGASGLTADRLPLPQLDPAVLQRVEGLEGQQGLTHAAQQLRNGLADMGVREMQMSDVLEWCVLPLFERHQQLLKQQQQQQQDRDEQEAQDKELMAALRFVVLSRQLQNEVCG